MVTKSVRGVWTRGWLVVGREAERPNKLNPYQESTNDPVPLLLLIALSFSLALLKAYLSFSTLEGLSQQQLSVTCTVWVAEWIRDESLSAANSDQTFIIVWYSLWWYDYQNTWAVTLYISIRLYGSRIDRKSSMTVRKVQRHTWNVAIFFEPHHFPETSFHRIVVLSKCDFTEWLFCRKKIAESHLTESSYGWIVELAKLHNAERDFSESSFSRTSFSRIVVQPNIVFPKHHLPERHFAEIVWSKTSFHRTLYRSAKHIVRLNEDSRKRHSAEWRFWKMIFG